MGKPVFSNIISITANKAFDEVIINFQHEYRSLDIVDENGQSLPQIARENVGEFVITRANAEALARIIGEVLAKADETEVEEKANE